MRVPVLVPVGGHKVPLRYVWRLSGENDYGEYVVEDRLIRVSKTRCSTPEIVWATVWHELAHAAVSLAGVGQIVSGVREEAVVTAIEFGMAPLMLFRQDVPGMRWREVSFPFERE